VGCVSRPGVTPARIVFASTSKHGPGDPGRGNIRRLPTVVDAIEFDQNQVRCNPYRMVRRALNVRVDRGF